MTAVPLLLLLSEVMLIIGSAILGISFSTGAERSISLASVDAALNRAKTVSESARRFAAERAELEAAGVPKDDREYLAVQSLELDYLKQARAAGEEVTLASKTLEASNREEAKARRNGAITLGLGLLGLGLALRDQRNSDLFDRLTLNEQLADRVEEAVKAALTAANAPPASDEDEASGPTAPAGAEPTT